MNKMKTDLTKPRQQLLERMQVIKYGFMENLHIRNGQPLFEPEPSITRSILLGGSNGAHEASRKKNFSIKNKVDELFGIFDQEQTFVIKRIVIDNGLPLKVLI